MALHIWYWPMQIARKRSKHDLTLSMKKLPLTAGRPKIITTFDGAISNIKVAPLASNVVGIAVTGMYCYT